MAIKNKQTSRPNSFQVPEGYFENFESRVMKNIGGQQSAFPSIKKSRIIAPWVGLAAAFLIIALVYNLVPQRIFNKQIVEKNESTSIFEFSTAEYFSEFELMELLTNETTINCEIYPDSLFFRDIDEEEIIMLTSLRWILND